MSTVNLVEALIIFRDRKPATEARLRGDLLDSGILFVPPDLAVAILAADARSRYPLNFGDCFAYALAKAERQSLLTLDADFRGLDVPVILPPEH